MSLYRLLLSVLAPVLVIGLLWRVLRGIETWGDLWQRLGMGAARRDPGDAIWVHGASNGELAAAKPVIEDLLRHAPRSRIVVTSNTVSARQMVQHWDLPQVTAMLAPLDLRWILRRWMKRSGLRNLLLVEADFWPNRIVTARNMGLNTALIGGRISSKSAKGWRKRPELARAMFGSFDLICAQDDVSLDRLKTLGAAPQSTGPKLNLKALAMGAARVDAVQKADPMIWLAASTHAGEDAIILEAHQLARTQIRGLRLILAPRHPKRAGEILQIAQGLGLSMIQRSHGGTLDDPGDVFLADTLGEMDIWYTASTSCFIAGSLVPKGGHTPFEPAAHGCALIHGPHVENFAEIYAALHDADAAIRVDSADTLAQAVINTIQAPQTARISRATAVLSQFHGHEEALKAIRDLVS